MTVIYNRKTNRLEAVSIKKVRSYKGKIIALFFVCAIVYGAVNFFSRTEKKLVVENEDVSFEEKSQVLGVKNEAKKVLGEKMSIHKISEGDIPAEIFSDFGKLDANDTASLLSSAKDVYDFTNVKIGQYLRFYFNGEDRVSRMEYEKNTEDIIIAERIGDQFTVRQEKIEYEVTEEIAKGKIDNFFYVDALEAGLSEATVLEVGDLFSFSIDFTTEIRQGDEFSFVYEKRKRDGADAPDGRILGAKFINDGDSYYAYYYEKNGVGGYYDQEGRALERQFLKAPLSFKRISSGYTGARLNPITRTVTTHYQIDYAAPSGTPVSSTARGTVTSAGWETGWGNMIRIRHDNGYTTHYGHLSGYAKGIKSGVSVAQGQIIGYVGSTGWSTGPHLDFGMKLNGSPINPLKLDLPKGEPLAQEEMTEFEDIKNKYSNSLE